jgi:cytochrome c
MSGFELNKLVAAILLSCLVAMLSGTLVNILYKPSNKKIVRGYEVEVSDMQAEEGGAPSAQEELNIPELMASANAEAGKSIIKKCISCHSFEALGPNKIGPNLYGTYNSKKGSKDGYTYSKALIGKGGIWDDESLFYFLHSPKAYIKGTKMAFIGIRKYQDIVNLIAYLKTLAN